jgi:predicted phosphoribosyltransferase
MARVVGVPLARNSAAHRRALQLAFERCATPLVMGTAKKLKPPTRVCVALPLGAPARLSCAAAGVSSGLAGAVKAAMIKSKLYKIEAVTVPCLTFLFLAPEKVIPDSCAANPVIHRNN